MRETALFFGYLLICLLLAAALSVPLMQTDWFNDEPRRVMTRLAQLLMLLGFWPLLRALGLNRRAALGLDRPLAALRLAVAGGWLLGAAMMAGIVGLLLLAGTRVLDESLPPNWPLSLAWRALGALVAGLLIALIEELFFRGALFAALRQRRSWWSAAVWSAALYALVHVLKPHALPSGVAFDWSGATRMLAGVFAGAWRWEHLDSLAALFLAGLFLALVRERTGLLAWSIGLHAGWVFVIQLARWLTDGVESAPWAWLAGSYDGVIGWLAALSIGSLTLAYGWRSRRASATLDSAPRPA